MDNEDGVQWWRWQGRPKAVAALDGMQWQGKDIVRRCHGNQKDLCLSFLYTVEIVIFY